MMHIFVNHKSLKNMITVYSWGRSGGGKIGLNGKKVGIKVTNQNMPGSATE